MNAALFEALVRQWSAACQLDPSQMWEMASGRAPIPSEWAEGIRDALGVPLASWAKVAPKPRFGPPVALDDIPRHHPGVKARGTSRVRAWIESRYGSVYGAADPLEVKRVTLNAWVSGRNKPPAWFKAKLEELSNGEVPASAWDEIQPLRGA